MTDINQVYNSHFLLWQEGNPDFPDGWATVGGDKATKWEWIGLPDGPRAIRIMHPSGPRAGIILENDVVVPAGEGQRWEFRVVLQAEPTEILCYIRIYLGAVSQYLFTVRPGSEPEEYIRVFSTPTGVTGIRVEIGILGEGVITIHEIQGRRLYPRRELRLDEKGQLYVRHIDSIGKIQAPVSVRLVSPIPIPVDVRTSTETNLRDLTPTRDGIKIYGSNGNSIESTLDGLIQVKMAGRKYVQSVESVTSSNVAVATIPKDVSEVSAYSYAVHNTGAEEVVVQLQISPDGAIWTADDLECVIFPGNLAVFTPNRFLRYVRLIYRSQSPNSLIVWFQGQG
ncbi:DUF6385 domain-containing protein [Desulfosporosinus youngiae]|uniref:DUF6385 domain-containing protein n=1 Tax=Desulfosporosinus youngiae DSM 17734 TaxID=768710 RepID=H5XRZ6_9FIRM|nr:DUF6385 domain-containing protein [Desulfosporosinus youngiae]EHQ87533.1 hypothetical protein DesyoDRAFT_0339 [Desulfosporosinus youngiae DSM 17734]